MGGFSSGGGGDPRRKSGSRPYGRRGIFSSALDPPEEKAMRKKKARSGYWPGRHKDLLCEKKCWVNAFERFVEKFQKEKKSFKRC